jgi:hypothetical protein
VRALAASWLDREDPGGWNQALMDLGREVCRPRPGCDICPIARRCRSRDAVPTAPRRRRDPAPFAGSPRQVRGSVVRSLRTRGWTTVGTLAGQTGFDAPAVVSAVLALHADGLVDAGPAARRGMREGRVRLRP